jgi:hypothetical protein
MSKAEGISDKNEDENHQELMYLTFSSMIKDRIWANPLFWLNFDPATARWFTPPTTLSLFTFITIFWYVHNSK